MKTDTDYHENEHGSGFYYRKRPSSTKINPWIQHVKQVQQHYGCSYGEALKLASQSYKHR